MILIITMFKKKKSKSVSSRTNIRFREQSFYKWISYKVANRRTAGSVGEHAKLPGIKHGGDLLMLCPADLQH